MRLRRSLRLEERSRLLPPEVAEGSELQLQQENRDEGENSMALAGVDSLPEIAMRGELQPGGSYCDCEASPFQTDYWEIPPNPPPQAHVQGPDRAAFRISKAAEVALPAIDSVMFTHTQSPGACVDDRNLLTRSKGKSSAEGRTNDSHDPDGFSKNLDLVGPTPAPTGSHSSHEDEHRSLSQSQMARAKGRRGRSAPIPWIGLPCSRCKSTNFSMYTIANTESDVKGMHYRCNNCKQRLCTAANVRAYKRLGRRSKVANLAKKGVSQRTRRGIAPHRSIQGMSNQLQEPSKVAASNSNMKAMMPPPSYSNMKAMRPPANPENMRLMPPPSYTRKPNHVSLPDSQDTAFRSAKTALPPRTLSCSDDLEDGHPWRESNLQLVVAPEPEEHFPMEILEAMGPFPLSASPNKPPSEKQSAEGNQRKSSFGGDSFSVTGLRDSIRGLPSLPLEENKEGSGGGVVSEGVRPSNGLPCPTCKSTNTRFCWVGRYYCNNCREYWTLGQLEQPEVQETAKRCSKGKEKVKETEMETQYENFDQFSGGFLGESSCGTLSLPLHGSEDGDDGSHQVPMKAPSCSRCKSTFTRLCTYGVFCDACGKHTPFEGTRDRDVSHQVPLNAPSCSRCKSTFTRLCTYGVFCDACGKHTPFEGTLDRQVPANPPVAMPDEVFDADGRTRGHQMQALPPPPPRRPIMVDASTQTDPVAIVPLDSRFGKHIVHGIRAPHKP